MLDPKPAYAQRARDILLEYASFYEGLPRHDRNNKESLAGAKLFAQTLNEGVILCSIAMGYDFVYDAPCFSKEDHALIADHFLRPMVALLQSHRSEKSNWQSWRNAGIASAGVLLRDADMLEFAINDPKSGFLNQMRVSVLPSGMCYEGAPSYHWYAFSAHIYLLETAARAGMDLYTIPAVKAMFDAPPNQLFPDLTFPAINDSGRSSIKSAARYYEVGYRRYDDPDYLVLREPRNTVWGLLWGKEAPEGSAIPDLKLPTTNDPDAGLAVLRNARHDIALFFNYSPQPGGHTHPAKLDIILYANGDERIVDPGRLSYGNPLHREWYYQTIAHNTVVVNETSQKHASGIFKEFQSMDGWSLARASLDAAYDGVLLERTVFLCDNIIVESSDARPRTRPSSTFRCTFSENSRVCPPGNRSKRFRSHESSPLPTVISISGMWLNWPRRREPSPWRRATARQSMSPHWIPRKHLPRKDAPSPQRSSFPLSFAVRPARTPTSSPSIRFWRRVNPRDPLRGESARPFGWQLAMWPSLSAMTPPRYASAASSRTPDLD